MSASACRYELEDMVAVVRQAMLKYCCRRWRPEVANLCNLLHPYDSSNISRLLQFESCAVAIWEDLHCLLDSGAKARLHLFESRATQAWATIPFRANRASRCPLANTTRELCLVFIRNPPFSWASLLVHELHTYPSFLVHSCRPFLLIVAVWALLSRYHCGTRQFLTLIQSPAIAGAK